MRKAAAAAVLWCMMSVAAAAGEGPAMAAGEHAMSEHEASGSFEVTITPETAADAPVARMSLVKRFHGDLDGSGTGEMLAVRTAVTGSAGYVAIERVVGSLGGRAGSFALQHDGIMDRGAPTLSVVVVPDSGTGALQGLSGSMTIDATGGQHRYAMRYRLPG